MGTGDAKRLLQGVNVGCRAAGPARSAARHNRTARSKLRRGDKALGPGHRFLVQGLHGLDQSVVFGRSADGDPQAALKAGQVVLTADHDAVRE
ncbi:hypothetical protein DEDE109153_13340 [Deinococcus deserti]